jgi:hypothetical protein
MTRAPENPRSQWAIQLVRWEPETRWFKRHILRRKTRRVLIASQVPVDFQFSRSLNGPDTRLSCTVEGRDALELYEMYRNTE